MASAPWLVRLGRRVRLSLTTWPDADGWCASAVAGAAVITVMAGLGLATGLYAIHAPDFTGMPTRLATVLVVPAFGEETIFRGLLVPDRREGGRPLTAAILALGLFVSWHVVEATTFLRAAAPMFLRWDFLVCAAILGLGCTIMRWRTGSIWPGVVLHWLMVTLWQTWLGGFRL